MGIIDTILKNKGYTIFYSGGCPYSEQAVELLEKKKLSFKGYIVEKHWNNKHELLDIFIKNKNKIAFDVNHRTKPIIFKNGKFIGGYAELVDRLKID